uniref:Oxidative stress induced growth inhibitor family member 2 n=1 Tax=Electrophorus electricus TaxID=8005 RepID=A0AAY5EIS9_ELEEL
QQAPPCVCSHRGNWKDEQRGEQVCNRHLVLAVPALALAVTMPLRDKNSLSRDGPPAMPVVIIGNGPSGICLSHLLSGYTPYLDAALVHPNPVLYHKLQEAKHLPITEQDLQYLCEGLEGRSGNPVAVLYDTLLHPDADRGFEFPSVLQWRLDKRHHIPHLILGKSAPGGAWHAMEGSMLTISLGIWMELPGVSYRDVNPAKRRYTPWPKDRLTITARTESRWRVLGAVPVGLGGVGYSHSVH